MKILQFLMALVAVASLATACSEGGRRRSTGRACTKPLDNPMNVAENQKLELAAKTDTAGTYDYAGASLVYVEDSGLRVEMADAKQRDGSYKAVITCIAGAKPTDEYTVTAIDPTGVTNMQLEASGKSIVDIKRFSILIDEEGRFRVESKTEQAQKSEAPSKTYDQTANQVFLYKIDVNNNVDFQIRSSGTDGRGRYYLTVSLKRR